MQIFLFVFTMGGFGNVIESLEQGTPEKNTDCKVVLRNINFKKIWELVQLIMRKAYQILYYTP